MSKGLTYAALALTIRVAGAVLFKSLEENVLDFDKVVWCKTDTKTMGDEYIDRIYETFSVQYDIPTSSIGRKKFIEQVYLKNGGILNKEEGYIPCGLNN